MTAWTTISNALVAVGAKPFATTIQALRDNVLAAMEGDATAHAAGVSLRLAALQRIVVGNTIKGRVDTTFSIPSTNFNRPTAFGFMQTGTVRATFEHRADAGTSEARFVRVRAGVLTALATHSQGTTFAARSLDIDVIPGDLIGFEHRHVGGTNNSEIRFMRISTNAASFVFPMDNYGAWENMT